MISAVVLFLSAVSVSKGCVPTSITTTTTPCCTMLGTSTLPRVPPTPANVNYQQCSVLHRVSSSCPEDGIIVCNAAPDTNPTGMRIQLFNTAGTLVRTFTNTGDTLSAKVFCENGVWVVNPMTGTTRVAIATVSCSQTGSTGADKGYVINSAQV